MEKEFDSFGDCGMSEYGVSAEDGMSDADCALRESGMFKKAKDKALSVMSRRMYTKKELIAKLTEKYGFDYDIAHEAAEWACEYGFINDAEYARTYISDCLCSNKYGIRRIKQALLHKGISSYVIEDVLCEFEIDEADSLVGLVRKKLAGNFDKKNTEKIIRHFAMKGYNFSDIKNAVSTVKSEAGAECDTEGEEWLES